MRKNINSDLFKAEQEVLQNALSDIANVEYRADGLLPRYKILTVQYQKLLRICRKIFSISDSQGLALQQQQNEMQMLLDNAEQGFLTFGPTLIVNQQYSRECERIFGKRISGMPVTELLSQGENICVENLADSLQQIFALPDAEGKQLLQRLSGIVTFGDRNVRIEYKKITQTVSKLNHILIMMIMTDITEKLRADAQIHYLSFHDKLTELYNRAYAEYIMPLLEQQDKLPLGIIMLDMNGLKVINDVFGHTQGDQQLVSLAGVLRQACHETGIICRWGGDEFVIFLPNTTQKECTAVCERIEYLCRKIKPSSIPLSAAMGSAVKMKLQTQLSEIFRIAESCMYSNKLKEGRRIRQEIIDSLLVRLEQHCFEQAGHNERIATLGTAFFSYLGLPDDSLELRTLQPLAILHDVGKVAIPKNILGKKGLLTDKERELIKLHSDIGYRMAHSIGDSSLADLILALHERWDGQGYPYGLQGKAIPWLARVFAIMETYDVITHERPYGMAMEKTEALAEIKCDSGKRFDPELANSFIQFMQERTC